MKKILVIGAGRSAVTLIQYLLDNAKTNNWFVTVADYSVNLAQQAVASHQSGQAIFFNVTDEKQREEEITNADIVISMLPASMHISVAKDCVRLGKNLVTASYVSKEIAALHEEAHKKGVLLLNEMGLDPGIDHMSAMQAIEKVKELGGKFLSFRSFCGGLIHPDYDNNPWNYKFTWNPRNVVLAGQGTAQYLEKGETKYIPYIRLFERTESILIPEIGEFEGYANRDSLSYRKAYGLEEIPSILRGTLRRKGFSKAWNTFVQLGLTDDSYKIANSASISNRSFLNMFLPFDEQLSVEEKFCRQMQITSDREIFEKVHWLGLFSKEEKSGIKDASPAQILQSILEKKWGMNPEDKDMIVMQHQFEFLLQDEIKTLHSSLVVFGETPRITAMAKTVGLPMAIATKLILDGKIKLTGVQIPTLKEIYLPVMQELEAYDIQFKEELI